MTAYRRWTSRERGGAGGGCVEAGREAPSGWLACRRACSHLCNHGGLRGATQVNAHGVPVGMDATVTTLQREGMQ